MRTGWQFSKGSRRLLEVHVHHAHADISELHDPLFSLLIFNLTILSLDFQLTINNMVNLVFVV